MEPVFRIFTIMFTVSSLFQLPFKKNLNINLLRYFVKKKIRILKMKIFLILTVYSIFIHSLLTFSVDVFNLRNDINHLRSKSVYIFLIFILRLPQWSSKIILKYQTEFEFSINISMFFFEFGLIELIKIIQIHQINHIKSFKCMVRFGSGKNSRVSL